jgi:hypothetical protein
MPQDPDGSFPPEGQIPAEAREVIRDLAGVVISLLEAATRYDPDSRTPDTQARDLALRILRLALDAQVALGRAEPYLDSGSSPEAEGENPASDF